MEVNIDINGNAEEAAQSAAAALDELYSATKQEANALRAMEQQMRAVQKAGSVDVDVYKKLSTQIDGQKSKVAGLNSEMVRLGGAGYKPAAQSGAKLTDEISGMSKEVSSIVPQLALMQVAFAALSGLWDGFKFAVGASEARLEVERSLEVIYGSEEAAKNTVSALASIQNTIAIDQERILEASSSLERAGLRNGDQMVQAVKAIGQADAARAGAGDAVQAIIERSARSNEWGYGGGFSVSMEELRKLGVSYEDLGDAIAKQTGAALDDAQLAIMSGSVDMETGLNALSSVIDSELGEVANKKFNTVTNATKRLRDNIAGLFSGFDSSAFGKALNQIADLFGETTVAGYYLREVVTGAFDLIGKSISAVLPLAEKAFYGIGIVALQVFVSVVGPAILKFQALMKSLGVESGSVGKTIENAFFGIARAIKFFGDYARPILTAVAVYALPSLVAGLTSAIPLMISFASTMAASAASTVLAAAPLWALGAAVVFMIWGLSQLADAAEDVAENWDIVSQQLSDDMAMLLKPLDDLLDAAFDWGEDLINGIVEGMKSAATGAVDAVKGVGTSISDGFKSVMGIASPSKVMMSYGQDVSAGLEQGIEQGSPGAQRALNSAVQPQLGSSVTNNNQTANGATVTFEAGAFTFNDVQNADQFKARLPELMADIFEQLGITMGAEAPS